MSKFGLFLRINWLKTLLFNFKTLPVKQAIRLPFVLAWKTSVKSYGKIILDAEIVRTAMISLGVLRLDMEETSIPLVISNKGTLRFKGRAKIHPGVKLVTSKGAEIEFNGYNVVGARTMLWATDHITIGEYSRCSWDCVITDSNFHYIVDIVRNKPMQKTKPVIIGDSVFLGNHTNIGKGVIIPSGCVISSWSNLNRSFKKDGENCLIAGNPANVVDTGYRMTRGYYNPEEEKEYDNYFNNKKR